GEYGKSPSTVTAEGLFVPVKRSAVYARNSARSDSRAGFGLAPRMLLATAPPLKTFIIGMEVIWYFAAVCGLSSTLSFTIVILSAFSEPIWSRIGPTARHGPHHSAQKSTRIVLSELRTSASKVASVTSRAFDMSFSLSIIESVTALAARPRRFQAVQPRSRARAVPWGANRGSARHRGPRRFRMPLP